jgi:hypothetical protein
MDARVILFVVVVVAAIASRPIDVWLWRRGKISDQTATVLLLGRLPALVFLTLLIGGASLVLAIVVTVPLIVMERLFYPFIRTLMDDVRRDLATKSPPAN